ncbi:MAG: inovirus-type Gp2 protein [Colwellia sp.]|nr:inovirus-type Gp2 protein [Colwellia sp.]
MIQLANNKQRFTFDSTNYRGLKLRDKNLVHEYVEAIYRMIDGSLNDQPTTCISRFSLTIPIQQLGKADELIDTFVNQLSKEAEDQLKTRRENCKEELADCNVKVIWSKQYSLYHHEPFYELVILCNDDSFLCSDGTPTSDYFELVNCVILAWAVTLKLTSRQSKRFVRFNHFLLTTVSDDLPIEESLSSRFHIYSKLARVTDKCFEEERESFWCSNYSMDELHEFVSKYHKQNPSLEESIEE